jgi:hypothetical protein
MTGNLKGRIEGAYNKLENLVKGVPGYSGYKEKEVRREADKLVRMQVARGLEAQRKRVTGVQLQLTNAGRLGMLMTLDRATMKLQLLIDRIKAASYGYAGLFDAVKVRDQELDALYNFDAALLGSVDKIKALVDAVAAAEKDEDVTQAGNALLEALEDANSTFSQRQDVILEAPAV